MSTTVLQEIVTITKESMKSEHETNREFMDRLIRSINSLDDDDWEAIPEDGKAWFNDAAKIISESEDSSYVLPMIPGLEELEKEEIEKEEKAINEEQETAPAPEKEEKKTRKPRAKASPLKKTREGPPVTQIAREMLCEDISISFEAFVEKLATAGVEIKKSTVQNVYLNSLRAYQTAIEVGEVKSGNKVVLKKN